MQRITDRELQSLRTSWQTLRIGIGAMGHQGRSHGGLPELRLIRQIKAAAEHRPQGFRRAPAPAGEQGIIGADRTAPHDHSINSTSQLMYPIPR